MKKINHLRKISILIFFIFSICLLPVFSGVIETYDGNSIQFNLILYSDSDILLDSEKRIPKEIVKKILFAGKTEQSEKIEESISDKNAKPLEKAEISEEISKLILKAEELKEKHRGCGAVIILDEGFNTINKNGSSVYRYHFIGKIYNENYLDWSKLSLGYAEGRSNIKVILARSISDDGFEFKMNPSDMKTITASQESRYFDNMYKSIYGNIPGAKTGSIIEYIYESDHYNPFDTMIIHGGWYFQDVIPVVKSSYHLTYPKGKKPQFKFTGLDSGRLEKIRSVYNSSDTSITEIYTMENIEPIIPEPYMPNKIGRASCRERV